MSVILGIDPGLRITGYGLLHKQKRQLHYISSGCIRTGMADMPIRLKFIYSKISAIITQFQPEFFAIEQVFVAKNPDSALKLGEARGVAIIAAINKNLNIFEYAARQVKKTVTGTGKAEKIHVQRMVRLLLNLSINIEADAADALAIAITHCYLS